MIECTNFKEHKEGCLTGFADFYIEKWQAEVKGCKIFEKDGKRWVKLPDRKFINDEGDTAYAPILKFLHVESNQIFSEKAIEAIDKFKSQKKPVN